MSPDTSGHVVPAPEQRNAVGDFIYQVSTDATSMAVGAAVIAGGQAIASKIGGGSGNSDGGPNQTRTPE